ncbi:hypothetical protein [Paenilisteria weihenstephanensis]|uniref:hypothetical protein n=1 Tax=Listeria weihenstephanensis TaxID=1006155 RepID=UPI0005647732|nr:hypothetical protein [Listeria weihenstephanensis]
MLKKWRSPVILMGSIMFVSALVFFIGYMFRIPYLRDAELGWILTTCIGAFLVLGFGFFWAWKDDVNKRKRSGTTSTHSHR